MIDLDDIRLYLPKYLSPETEGKLFTDLRGYPATIDARMYGFIGKSDSVLYQGDGLNAMPVTNLPSKEIKNLPCIVISNTCDINPESEKKYATNVVYAPVASVRKYRALLLERQVYTEQQAEDHLRSIRQQEIAPIFYLPESQYMQEESIVFFDRVCNCEASFIDREKLRGARFFSLSEFGFYMFLIKLSIHFTRMQERVDRRY
jgi:hypothetical protein